MKTISRALLSLSLTLIKGATEEVDNSILKEKWHEYLHRPEIERELQARIIGGSDAPNGAYPWYAVPFTGEEFLVGGCGSSLVAPDMLLTASHCVPAFVEALLTGGGVIIGLICLDSESNCDQEYDIQFIDSIFPHPAYHQNAIFGSLEHDLAVIKLEDSTFIDPVPLDQGTVSKSYNSEKKLWTLGFGDTDKTSGVDIPSKLSHVDVQYVPMGKCDKMYDFISIDNSMLCAGSPGKDSCQGDSGGPLYDVENDALVGIVSWGLGCADDSHPGVYANIASQWAWIQKTICDNHGENNDPKFCKEMQNNECSQGEKKFSLKIETNEMGGDSEWGIYNHGNEILIVREGKEYWYHSTYYSEFCIEEDVCHTLYLSGDYLTDSSFEATFDGNVVRGEFYANVMNSLPLSGVNCTDGDLDPFSGVQKISLKFHCFWGIAGALFSYLY